MTKANYRFNSDQLARHMAMYPIIYIILWILPTIVVLYHVSTNTAAPFPLQTVDKVRLKAPDQNTFTVYITVSNMESSPLLLSRDSSTPSHMVSASHP